MAATLKDFQQTVRDGIAARFGNVRALYAQLSAASPAQRTAAKAYQTSVT